MDAGDTGVDSQSVGKHAVVDAANGQLCRPLLFRRHSTKAFRQPTELASSQLLSLTFMSGRDSVDNARIEFKKETLHPNIASTLLEEEG
jgi:hypothetical protein